MHGCEGDQPAPARVTDGDVTHRVLTYTKIVYNKWQKFWHFKSNRGNFMHVTMITSRCMVGAAVCRTLLLLGTLGFLLGGTPLAFAGPTADANSESGATPVDFVHEIAPVIQKRCGECHVGQRAEAGLSFNTRQSLLKAEVIVIGHPEESELIRRISSDDPDERMPPKGPPLDPQTVEKFKLWIAQGAPWEEGYTLNPQDDHAEPPLKLADVAVPPAGDRLTHPIDRLVREYFRAHNIAFPQVVDDQTFLRRVGFDLVGLPPTPGEIAEFRADPAPDKRDRWVRRLLDDRTAYADHWMSFWNDLLRNDYTGTGYIDGGRKQISAWLYIALYNNMPYDQFVRELVAPSSPESEGFMRGIKWRGNVNASQRVELQFAQTTSQVFLGINMKCASCHDSFIDRWKLTDAYGLAAIVAEEPLEIHRCDKPTGQIAQPHFLYPELGDIDPNQPPKERLKEYARLLTVADNGRTSRTIVNRIWHRLMGRGLVHPVDMMSQPAWSPELLDYLARYLVDHKWDLKELIYHICTSRIYQAVCDESVTPGEEKYVFRGPLPRRITAEQFCDTVWRLTGSSPAKPAFNPPVPERKADFVRASLTVADAFQMALGRPQRDVVVSTRPEVITTLQALNLSIGPRLHQDLEAGARNLIQKFADKPADDLVRHIYLMTLTREPTPAEKQVLKSVLDIESLDVPTQSLEASHVEDLLWMIVMLPEFQTIR